MRSENRNCLHWDAVSYYYDVVAQDGSEVPDAIARHIRQCLFCRVHVRRLKEMLAELEHGTDPQRDRMSRDIIDTLNLHFRCLGEPVTCAQVKPFLPGLLPPSPQVRIPTPITVHVDQCPDCAEDLSVLRGLALTGEQLRRLGRLYAAKPAADPSLCGRARLKIPAFASAAPQDIEREVLDHLCSCPACREQVYQHRQTLLEGAAATGSCDKVSMADVFDYAVADDGKGASDRSTAARPPGAHVRDCRRCMETIQTVHRAIYHIAERRDSDVVTVYNTLEDTASGPAADALYPRYPIDVQVIRRPAEGPAAAKTFRRAAAVAAFSRSATLAHTSKWLKAAIAAAALIAVAFVFFNTPTASGISYSDVTGALARADNVHMASYYRDVATPTYEVWASRSAGVLMRATGQTRTVYDLKRKTVKHIDLAVGTTESGELSRDDYENASTFAEGHLGLTSVRVPSDATWSSVGGDEASETGVYELAWTEKLRSGRSMLFRWEIEIDTTTRLPRRACAFTRQSADTEWQGASRFEYEYPTADQLRAVIEDSDSLP